MFDSEWTIRSRVRSLNTISVDNGKISDVVSWCVRTVRTWSVMKYKKHNEQGEHGLRYRQNFQFDETWTCEAYCIWCSMHKIPKNLKRNVRDDWKAGYRRCSYLWNGNDL
jgi:hypothetical protein